MKSKIFSLLFIVSFVACTSDSNNEKLDGVRLDPSLLLGEWVTYSPTHQSFTDLLLKVGYGVEISVIQKQLGDSCVSYEDKGSWSLSEQELELSFVMVKDPISKCEISAICTDSLVLRSKNQNYTDTYFRVVERIELDAGCSAKIEYIEEQSSSVLLEIRSSNEDIVTVNNDGVITAHQGGTAFVLLKMDTGLFFIKVSVKSRVEKLAGEVHLSIDEVMSIHGQPDDISEFTDGVGGKMNDAYYNSPNDSEIDFIVYRYDRLTNELQFIFTAYKSEISFDSDIHYLDSYYLKQRLFLNKPLPGIFYGKNEFMYQNDYIVVPDTYYSSGVWYYNTNYNTTAFSNEWDWYVNLFYRAPVKMENLFMEPYLVWNGKVNDVKDYMKDFEIVHDLTLVGEGDTDFYIMQFTGNDDNGDKMYYEYHFKNKSSGLFWIGVTLKSEDVDVSTINSHLLYNNYSYLGYYNNHYSYTSDNAYVTVFFNSKGSLCLSYEENTFPNTQQ